MGAVSSGTNEDARILQAWSDVLFRHPVIGATSCKATMYPVRGRHLFIIANMALIPKHSPEKRNRRGSGVVNKMFARQADAFFYSRQASFFVLSTLQPKPLLRRSTMLVTTCCTSSSCHLPVGGHSTNGHLSFPSKR